MRQLLNTLFVTSEDIYLSLDGENVVANREKEVLARHPLHTLSGIISFVYPGIQPVGPRLRLGAGERGAGLLRGLSPPGSPRPELPGSGSDGGAAPLHGGPLRPHPGQQPGTQAGGFRLPGERRGLFDGRGTARLPATAAGAETGNADPSVSGRDNPLGAPDPIGYVPLYMEIGDALQYIGSYSVCGCLLEATILS